MKTELNGATVEIKVTPAGAKKADTEMAKTLCGDIQIALCHAANFCTGNGFLLRAEYYLELAKAFSEAK